MLCPWHARGEVDNILLPHMQKSREALADARKSIRKRIENKQWTYCSSFMSKTWFYSLAPLSWFFCFLIRNLIHFVLLFITVTGVKILTTMLIPGTTLIKNGSSFPLPRLLRAPRILKMAHLSHHHAYSGQHVYSRGKSNQIIVNPLHRR